MFGPLLGLAGSVVSGILGNRQANKQMDMQKEFAQEGVQWKVADAKAAGVHPMAALGMQPFNYSPVMAGTPDFGAALGDMGANIDRAVMVNKTAPQRASIAGTALALERGKLENDLLKLQKLKVARELSPPAQGITSGGKDNLLSPIRGVTTVPKDTSVTLMPIRDANGVTRMLVANPGLADTAQSHYGDPGEAVVGVPALASDLTYMGQREASPTINWWENAGRKVKGYYR